MGYYSWPFALPLFCPSLLPLNFNVAEILARMNCGGLDPKLNFEIEGLAANVVVASVSIFCDRISVRRGPTCMCLCLAFRFFIPDNFSQGWTPFGAHFL